MTTPHIALRTKILNAAAGAIATQYGPSGLEKKFRTMRKGPWKPDLTAPACTTTDTGRRRGDPTPDGTNNSTQIQMLNITLDLPANWDKDDGGAAWAIVVEGIEVLLARLPYASNDMGLISVEVVLDAPLEVILEAGKSKHIWSLDVEVRHAATFSLVEVPEEEEP